MVPAAVSMPWQLPLDSSTVGSCPTSFSSVPMLLHPEIPQVDASACLLQMLAVATSAGAPHAALNGSSPACTADAVMMQAAAGLVAPPPLLPQVISVSQTQTVVPHHLLGHVPVLAPAATPVQQPWQQLQATPRAAPQRRQQPGSTVFFAGVTPVVDVQPLVGLFGSFGAVLDINLFRSYNGCKTSKGCGLVTFANVQEAAAAMDALHGKFVWPGARSPMVIEWMDPSKQHKKRRAQPLATLATQQQQQPTRGSWGLLAAAGGFASTSTRQTAGMPRLSGAAGPAQAASMSQAQKGSSAFTTGWHAHLLS